MSVNTYSIILNTICFVTLVFNLSPTINALLFLFVSLSCFIFFGKEFGKYSSARGLFALFWFGSIALSCLRIHPLQTEWQNKTIISLGLVFPAFMTGYSFYESLSKKSSKNTKEKKIKIDTYYKPIVFLGILIVIAFLLDCFYSKNVPIFNRSSMSAYATFGMPMVHYLTVSAGFYPTLIFCYCRNKEVSISNEPILLGLSVFSFLVPIFIVSRQLLLFEVFLFICAWLLYERQSINITKILTVKRIIIALVLALLTVCLYLVISASRNQNEYYLTQVFALPSVPSKLGMTGWQSYLYVAFNYDNFNYLVNHLRSFSYGANTFAPIIALLQLKSFIPDNFVSLNGLMLLPTYTTYPIAYSGYRDFGIAGVALSLLLIGVVTSAVERKTEVTSSIVYNCIYYLVLYSLVFCFFSNMFANTTIWVYAILLLFVELAANLLNKAEKKR